MRVTRRTFLKVAAASAAALGLSQTQLIELAEKVMGRDASIGAPRVIWLQGQNCTGCTTSFLNLNWDGQPEQLYGEVARALGAGGLGPGPTPPPSGQAQVLSLAGLEPDAAPTITLAASGLPGDSSITVNWPASPTGFDVDDLILIGNRSGTYEYQKVASRTINPSATGTITFPTGNVLANSYPSGAPNGNVVDDSKAKTTIDDVLLDIIDLKYLQTVQATGGEGAYNIIRYGGSGFGSDSTAKILIVEGSIPAQTAWPEKKYCTVGADFTTGAELYIGDVVANLASAANAVLAVGTCASFGGVPAARVLDDVTVGGGGIIRTPRPTTSAMGVGSYLQSQNVTTPVANIPGCHVHPDWVLGTIVHMLLEGALANPPTSVISWATANCDTYGRPKAYFGDTIHGGRCPRYQDYCNGKFATVPGQYVGGSTAGGCLAKLGCKGFSTYADCAFGGPSTTQKGRGWNISGRTGKSPASDLTQGSSCINNGYPCMGCVEKGFPDKYSPFFIY